MNNNEIKQDRECSFCGKQEKDVNILLAGPMVNICDKCVEICNQLIKFENDKRSKQGEIFPRDSNNPLELSSFV